MIETTLEFIAIGLAIIGAFVIGYNYGHFRGYFQGLARGKR